ncbi:hypothetical protein AB0O40_22840, partial [Streptomyces sp. NPDC089919]
MVTFAQAQERAEEWVNGDVPAYQHREVRVREFGLGFVVWAEDRPGVPVSGGGRQRLVIARDSGEATLWPGLPVGEVIRRYEEEYGTGPAVASEASVPPQRIDSEMTSFMLSPPEWADAVPGGAPAGGAGAPAAVPPVPDLPADPPAGSGERSVAFADPADRAEPFGAPAGGARDAADPYAGDFVPQPPAQAPAADGSLRLSGSGASGGSEEQDAPGAAGPGDVPPPGAPGGSGGEAFAAPAVPPLPPVPPSAPAAGGSLRLSSSGAAPDAAADAPADPLPGTVVLGAIGGGAEDGPAFPEPAPVPSGSTPWAGTDTNQDSDDASVPLPATVFAPPLSGTDADEPARPGAAPEAKTTLMAGGSQLPKTAVSPVIGDGPAARPEAEVPAPARPAPPAPPGPSSTTSCSSPTSSASAPAT